MSNANIGKTNIGKTNIGKTNIGKTNIGKTKKSITAIMLILSITLTLSLSACTQAKGQAAATTGGSASALTGDQTSASEGSANAQAADQMAADQTTAAEDPASTQSGGQTPVDQSPADQSPVETQTKSFTDSVGRTVELPAQIDKVALSGPLAQIVLFALCPDKLVGISSEWSKDAEEYLEPKYFNMPVIGQLYGGKGELNLETLLASGAQVVIDVGQPKGSITEDLDALQEQTGIPFVHITADTETMGDAYRKLGELLNMQDEAETLAGYCDRVYARTKDIADKVDKVKLLYITGDEGLNVIAKRSYHSEVIDLLSDNLAVVDEPSSKGSGNEVDMEQILNWNPDYILFAPNSVYSSVGDDPIWQSITAVKNGTYYEVPQGPYNWMGFPPSVQRILGMMWMAKLLYPENADYDLQSEVTEYYKLFYHCDLTHKQYDALVANSIGKQ